MPFPLYSATHSYYFSSKCLHRTFCHLYYAPRLNSTEMDFWRRAARISRKDKIRNNIIKQKMNVTKSVLEDIKTKPLKWYGHVQRMEEGRLPKKML